jgi:hypothetical protein
VQEANPVATPVGRASEAALHGCRGSFTFHFSPVTFHRLPSLREIFCAFLRLS